MGNWRNKYYLCRLNLMLMLTENAIQYTLTHLLNVAMPLRVRPNFSLEITEEVVTVTFAGDYRLRIARLTSAETEHLFNGKNSSNVVRIPSADGNVLVPLFFASKQSNTEVTCNPSDGALEIPYDLITPSFYLLSRKEEQQTDQRDVHGRFRFSDSLAYRYNFIGLPLADEYAMLLRKWVLDMLRPNWDIVPRTSRIIPTHDIDLLHRFQTPFQAFKSIMGRDLILDHNLAAAKASCREYRAWRKNRQDDPYLKAIQELAQASQEHGLESIFFFKAQLPGEYDCNYSIEHPDIAHCLDIIQDYRMRVGLHGSFDSYQNPELFKQEKERLETATGTPVTLGRQHYLRFETKSRSTASDTLHVWQAEGITDDYTLGYAEQPGFRCGTCHPYLLYDLQNDCVSPVVEHPLLVMDGSLLEYLNLSIEESNSLIDNILNRCSAVEGDFVVLWHTHLLSRKYRNVYEQVYLRLLEKQKS